METIYSAGIRACEVRRLLVSDVDFTDGVLRVQGKGGHERRSPLGRSALQWLVRYLEEARPKLKPRSEALFVTRYGLAFSPSGMSIRLQHLADGVPTTTVRVTAHALRRAAAAHCQQAGMSVREIQEFLGHLQLDTTIRYTGIGRRDLAQAVERFHPRGQMKHGALPSGEKP